MFSFINKKAQHFEMLGKNTINKNYLPALSLETVNFFLPLRLRAANTLLPFAVAILSLKPCLFTLFLLEG
jgi:hypothetical protein